MIVTYVISQWSSTPRTIVIPYFKTSSLCEEKLLNHIFSYIKNNDIDIEKLKKCYNNNIPNPAILWMSL